MKYILTAIVVCVAGYAAPAAAESCPWDMVWSPAKQDCIYLPEGGNAGTSNINTATGGNASAGAAAGSISGSNSNAKGGAGGSASATGSVNNRVSVTNLSNYAAAASTAAAVSLPGQFASNCFGDVNPSGGFGASVQGLGFGVAATSSKASNICALVALAGPAAGIAYLQRMDPNVPRNITVQQPTGRVTCPASHPVFVAGKGCRK